MSIQLYNTLTRRKELFQPIDAADVRVYVCGPTVYDYAHIGNARPVVVFDTLYRLLRRAYGAGHVTYVRNITDVEDKIIAAAAERGEAIADLTRRTTAIYHADMAALNALAPDHEPRATAFIGEMVAMIQTLIDAAMPMSPRAMSLFNVPSMPDYGELARRSQDDMIAGARVEVAPYKKHAADFVLWKPSDAVAAGLAQPLGPRQAGLAYRMLGHGGSQARRHLRYPWRRHRSHLPPS